MRDVIEFVHDWFAEVETVPGRMRQVAFRKGMSLQAEIRRSKSVNGSANLHLADGTVAVGVPVWCISVRAQARAA
jgi:hypothetical protein